MAPNTSQLGKVAGEAALGDVDVSYVKYGTPLPALTSLKADKNEFLPVWQQEVRDEQGRRRLHGAFTGGFSAGYFNTVGSKEGWTPATFKSSRTDKSKQADLGQDSDPKAVRNFSRRPEDFMDAEDLAEFEGRKELETHAIFAPSAAESVLPSAADGYDPLTGQAPTQSDPLALSRMVGPNKTDAALSDLIRPSEARIGQMIMTKMGWRPGQGVGPRVTYERRKQLALKLQVSLESLGDEEPDAEHQKHLFAPVDRPLKAVVPWPGHCGLGYKSSTSSSDLASLGSIKAPKGEALKFKIDGKQAPRGASFGLGALNELEDDDHDVYSPAPDLVATDSRARRLVSLDASEESFRKPERTTSYAEPSPIGPRNFADGAPLLKYFRLALSILDQDPNQSRLLQVPDSWEPNPKKVFEHGNAALKGRQKSTIQPTRPITAHDRGHLLGETQPPKSVFDFLSAKDRARIESARQSALAAASIKVGDSLAKSDSSRPPAAPIVVPKLDRGIAQAALRGFMPFSHDLAKQQRYRLYLQSQIGILPDGVQFAPKPTAEESADVINNELDGFVKSAMMFKPMSSMMASRFTSATTTMAGGEIAAPEPGLRQPVFSQDAPEEPPHEDGLKAGDEKVSPAVQAVRMDIFGMMTRTVKEFYPQKLLCKRLNVPNPFPQGPPLETKPQAAGGKLSDFLISHGFQPAATEKEGSLSKADPPIDNEWLSSTAADEPAKALNQVGLGNDETQESEIFTTRPPLDLFKAIFCNDDDEDIEGTQDYQGRQAPDSQTSHCVPQPHQPPSSLPPPPNHVECPSLMNLDENPSQCDILSPKVTSLTPKTVDADASEKLFGFRPTFLRKTPAKTQETVTNTTAPLTTTTTKSSSTKKSKKAPKMKSMISFDDEMNDGHLGVAVEKSSLSKKKHKLKAEHDKKLSKSDRTWTKESTKRKPRPDELTEEGEEEWVEKVVMPANSADLGGSITTSSVSQGVVDSYSVNAAPKKIRRMKASDLIE